MQRCGHNAPGDRSSQSLREGDETGLEALMPLVHEELRRIARRCLYVERAIHSVQTTELVNEPFLRLVDRQVVCQNRMHFLAMSARLLRRVLVDLARSRSADKRGNGVARMSPDEAAIGGVACDADVIRHDDVPPALAALDDRRSRVVELTLFRRADRRPDRLGAPDLIEDGAARLGAGPGVPVAGIVARGGT
jgi:RNA polymerase sigma factor (TIGR02999 family)